MVNTESIVITKENDGDAFNFFEESSDDSEIDVSRKHKPSSSNSRRPMSRARAAKTRHVAAPPPPTPNRSTVVQPTATLNDNMFEVFTNPDKTRVEESEDEFPPPTTNDAEPWQNDYSGSEEGGVGAEDEYDQQQHPSVGFNTIEEEKQDLLYKFYRLTSKGIPVSRKFNMQSDINEMRSEFNRIQRDNDVKSSIRFSRRMLMACVTGIEFLNKRYDPFEVKLEGWSESVMENMDDYDNVFERLHDKYASKVSMAPEIELLLSLAGSAFMFHLTNSMFNSLPNLKDIAKQNPDVLKNMMQSMSATMSANAQPTPTTNSQQHPESSSAGGEREMRPPAMDMSNLFNMMQPMLTPPGGGGGTTNPGGAVVPVGNATFPIHSRTTDINNKPPPPPLERRASISSISSISSLSGAAVESRGGNDMNKPKIISFSESNTVGGTKKKGRGKNKIISTSDNTMSI